MPIYLFYFLSSRRDHLADLAGQLSFLKPDIRNDLVYLIRQFADILEGFFRGQILIGFMMGVGYAIGFSVAGLKFGIALGLLFGVLNIVPFMELFWEFIRIYSILPANGWSLGKRAMGCDVGMWCYLFGCSVAGELLAESSGNGRTNRLTPGGNYCICFFLGYSI